MPVFPASDDRRRRALLILLLLARDADLAPEQVVGPEARALAGRALTRGVRGTRSRAWTCPRGRATD